MLTAWTQWILIGYLGMSSYQQAQLLRLCWHLEPVAAAAVQWLAELPLATGMTVLLREVTL